jgi:hypothetical protein
MIKLPNEPIRNPGLSPTRADDWSQRLAEAVLDNDVNTTCRVMKEERRVDGKTCDFVAGLCVQAAERTDGEEPSETLQALARFSGFCTVTIPLFVGMRQDIGIDKKIQLVKAFLKNGFAPKLPECQVDVDPRIVNLIEKHARDLEEKFKDHEEKKRRKHGMQEYQPYFFLKRRQAICLNDEIVASDGLKFQCRHFDMFLRRQAANQFKNSLSLFKSEDGTKAALCEVGYGVLQAAYDQPTSSVQCSDAALGKAIFALAANLKDGEAVSFGVRINSDSDIPGHHLTLVLRKEDGFLKCLLHDANITENAAHIGYLAHDDCGISGITLSSFLKRDYSFFKGTFSLLSVPDSFVIRFSGKLVDSTIEDQVRSVADALMDNNALHIQRIGALIAEGSGPLVAEFTKQSAGLRLALIKALRKGYAEAVNALGSLLFGCATTDDEKSYCAELLLSGVDGTMQSGDEGAIRACGEILMNARIAPDQLLALSMTPRGSPKTCGLIRALAVGNAEAVRLYAGLLLRAEVTEDRLLKLVDERDKSGRNILQHALKKGWGEAVCACIELLIQAGIQDQRLLNLFLSKSKDDEWLLRTAMRTRQADVILAFAQAVEVMKGALLDEQRKSLLTTIRDAHGAYKWKWYTLGYSWVNEPYYLQLKENDPASYGTIKRMKRSLK